MTDRSPWLSLMARRWYDRRTFAAIDLPGLPDLAARKLADGSRVSVVLPALNEAETVGGIVDCIARDLLGVLVDELIVVDSDSTDGTAAIAAAAGAHVVRMADLLPEIPAERGKGESLWRSLSMITGDIVVWIDADIRNFQPHFITRLVAPLLLDPDLAFIKGFYNRPIALGHAMMPSGGGRVTELLARPLLSNFFPELSGLVQPLSGEYAGRRAVLERLPFFTGYSVEVGLLIDLVEQVGLDAIAQVDLTERVHRNRPLDELGPMAYAIARTIFKRAEEWGRLRTTLDYTGLPLMIPDAAGFEVCDIRELERPPLSVLMPSLHALRAPEVVVEAADATTIAAL